MLGFDRATETLSCAPGIVFVVGKAAAAEAKISHHPLTVSELEHVQPELFRLGRLLDEISPAIAPLARPRLR